MSKKIEPVEDLHPLFSSERVKKAIKNPEKFWNLSEIPHTRQEAWDWMLKEMAKCDKCLLAQTRNKVVLPDGDLSAKIMIVLQNPSVNEDLTGIPITGAMELRSSDCGKCTKVEKCYSGRLLKNEKDFPKKATPVVCSPNLQSSQTLSRNFYLRSTGSVIDGIILSKFKMDNPRLNWVKEYNRNNPYKKLTEESPWLFTNTIACRPTDQEKLKELPDATVPKNVCKPWLLLQWVLLQPEVLICLGQESLNFFINKQEELKDIFINVPYQSETWGTVIFNTHPAAIMRDPVKESKGLSYAKLGETLSLALELSNGQIC